MRNLLVLLALAFVVTSCTKTEVKEKICDAGKKAATLLTAEVAVDLDCADTAAIQADIEKKLVDLKVCLAPAPTPTVAVKALSPIGDIICKPVVDALVASLVVQIPATWQCKGGKVSDDLKAKLLAQCSKAL